MSLDEAFRTLIRQEVAASLNSGFKGVSRRRIFLKRSV